MGHARSLLKRLVLPAWNRGHWLARRVAQYGEAVRRGRVERCAVCGRRAAMLYHRGVIPDRLVEVWGISPRLAEAFARKESCNCNWCGAKLRARRLAETILTTFPCGATRARSITEWVQRPEARALCIAEINRIDGLHEQLCKLPFVSSSDFQPDALPGAVIEGVRSEDLERLTYAESSFDLVLTSESLEHVSDLTRALDEIHRVLKPGGWHIFTIPWLPHVASTFARTVRQPDGTLTHRAPEIRHPGGDAGYLVFTEIGRDFPELVAQSGFEVRLQFGPPTDDDVAQVFATQKPVEPKARG